MARAHSSDPAAVSTGTITDVPHPDLEYLRRIADRTDPAAILRETKFLDAQKLFFDVVQKLGGSVDFEIADMHEVHAVAALADSAKGLRVLDLGCGSTEPYVLDDTFRDRYPPFFAEMMARLGATVTGIDIRPQKHAGYDHRVLDLATSEWMRSVDGPYDVIACFSLFNAPESPFERDGELCDRLMADMRGLLAPGGIVIVNVQDGRSAADAPYGFKLLHCDGNCAWLRSGGKGE